jgi:VanZ family protein
VPFGLWIAVIFALSSIPDLNAPPVGLPLADKLVHACEYGILGALWARARGGGHSPAMIAAGALLGAVVGASDEAHQSTVPGREVDVFDIVADTIGAAAGVWVFGRWRAMASRR